MYFSNFLNIKVGSNSGVNNIDGDDDVGVNEYCNRRVTTIKVKDENGINIYE